MWPYSPMALFEKISEVVVRVQVKLGRPSGGYMVLVAYVDVVVIIGIGQ